MANKILITVLLWAIGLGANAEIKVTNHKEWGQLGMCYAAFAFIGFYEQCEAIEEHTQASIMLVDDRKLAFWRAKAYGQGQGTYTESLALHSEQSPSEAKAKALDIINEKGCYRLVNSIDATYK